MRLELTPKNSKFFIKRESGFTDKAEFKYKVEYNFCKKLEFFADSTDSRENQLSSRRVLMYSRLLVVSSTRKESDSRPIIYITCKFND